MNEAAIKLALQALYETLSEEQQGELRNRLYYNAWKHELPTTDEDDALELLKGY